MTVATPLILTPPVPGRPPWHLADLSSAQMTDLPEQPRSELVSALLPQLWSPSRAITAPTPNCGQLAGAST